MSDFFQFVVEGLTTGSFYALVALGYTMVYGIIRLINFAHGDLYMVGAFIGWTGADGACVRASAARPGAADRAGRRDDGHRRARPAIQRLAYQPLLARRGCRS